MALYQFPGSDFHDLNLDWLLSEMKNCLAEWASTKADWESLRTDNAAFLARVESEWDSMRDFITEYFDNLDVSDEVSNKINAMAADGSLLAVIRDTVANSSATAADAWLEQNITQETGYVLDASLTMENAAAPAKTVGDTIAKFTTKSNNLFCVTNATDRTYSNGAVVHFISPSHMIVNKEDASGTAVRIGCMGNNNYVSGTFQKNLDAGKYYINFDSNVSHAAIYIGARNSQLESTVVHAPAGVFTFTEDMEIWFAISNRIITNGDVKITIAKVESDTDIVPYTDYGSYTAIDKIAREQIEEIASQTDGMGGKYANAAKYTDIGYKAYVAYPRQYISEYVMDIPMNAAVPTGNSATSGMCSDGIRYIWVLVRSGETNPMSIYKIDTFTNSVVSENHDHVLGHGQSMCYKDGELFIVSYVSGDSVTVAAGGTKDRITVLDAETLELKRTIGWSMLVPESAAYNNRLQAIGYSKDYGCFVGITPAVNETYTQRVIALFTENAIINTFDLGTSQAICDGVLATKSFICPMLTYRLAFYSWSNGEQIGYNAAHKILETQESTLGTVLESESVTICNGALYVNANVMGATQSEPGAMKLFKAYPINYSIT